MTLLGTVYALDDDQRIQIASKGGTGHWFAGTAAEYLELWKTLDEMTETAARRAMLAAHRTLESRQKWMSWNEYLTASMKKAKGEGGTPQALEDSYDEYVRGMEHKRELAEERYEERKKCYVGFVSPSVREVVDSYRSIVHPDAIILVVQGKEWGAFWNIDERDPRGVPYSFGTSNGERKD